MVIRKGMKITHAKTNYMSRELHYSPNPCKRRYYNNGTCIVGDVTCKNCKKKLGK
jgi:hypothetical protein